MRVSPFVACVLLAAVLPVHAAPEFYTEQQHVRKPDGSERLITVKKKRKFATTKAPSGTTKPRAVMAKTATKATTTKAVKAVQKGGNLQASNNTGHTPVKAVASDGSTPFRVVSASASGSMPSTGVGKSAQKASTPARKVSQEKEKKEGWYKWWKGLLIALAALAVIGIIAGLWVYGHKKRHAATATRVTTTTRAATDIETGLNANTTVVQPAEIRTTTTEEIKTAAPAATEGAAPAEAPAPAPDAAAPAPAPVTAQPSGPKSGELGKNGDVVVTEKLNQGAAAKHRR